MLLKEYKNTFPMVPKPLFNSKATSFYAPLKFLVSKKNVENSEIFEKMLRLGKVNQRLGQIQYDKVPKVQKIFRKCQNSILKNFGHFC